MIFVTEGNIMLTILCLQNMLNITHENVHAA